MNEYGLSKEEEQEIQIEIMCIKLGMCRDCFNKIMKQKLKEAEK